MKYFVKHLIKDGMLPSIVRKSILNCHTMGLHSIMLMESPEKTIRVFIAEECHELWKNIPNTYWPMSVGFHNHHCDISLEVIKGGISNWQVEEPSADCTQIVMSLKKHEYHSYINGWKGGFSMLGESKLVTSTREDMYSANRPFVNMAANRLHTVSVEKGKSAAWFVYEGKENRDYIPVCHSNVDLTSHTNEGLYIKPTEEKVLEILRSIDLI